MNKPPPGHQSYNIEKINMMTFEERKQSIDQRYASAMPKQQANFNLANMKQSVPSNAAAAAGA